MKKNKTSESCKKERGFSLVEVLVYMTVLTLILSIILGSLTVVAEIQERVVAGKDLSKSASISLDRILRETRLSESINTEETVFDNPEGVLFLEREDVVGGVKFYLFEGSLYIEKEGEVGRLNHKNTEVEHFYLREIITEKYEAVKIEMKISYPYSNGSIEQSFQSTAILRGSYEN